MAGGLLAAGVGEVVTADFNGDGRTDVAGMLYGSSWPTGINVHFNQAAAPYFFSARTSRSRPRREIEVYAR